MKVKKNKKIIWGVGLIVILLCVFYILQLDFWEVKFRGIDNDVILSNQFNDSNYAKINEGVSINEELLRGEWVAIYEDMLFERNGAGNFSIEFDDGKYLIKKDKFYEEGNYFIDDENKINFYIGDVDNSHDSVWGFVEGDTLILEFPKYPKIVVFGRLK